VTINQKRQTKKRNIENVKELAAASDVIRPQHSIFIYGCSIAFPFDPKKATKFRTFDPPSLIEQLWHSVSTLKEFQNDLVTDNRRNQITTFQEIIYSAPSTKSAWSFKVGTSIKQTRKRLVTGNSKIFTENHQAGRCCRGKEL
jgi:hypothetical protein